MLFDFLKRADGNPVAAATASLCRTREAVVSNSGAGGAPEPLSPAAGGY